MIAHRGDATAGPFSGSKRLVLRWPPEGSLVVKFMIGAPRVGAGVAGVRRQQHDGPRRRQVDDLAVLTSRRWASATSPATATAWVSIVRSFANGFGVGLEPDFRSHRHNRAARGDANAFIGAQFMTELGEPPYRESNKVYFAGVRMGVYS
jgi:hypothetical protein